MGDWKCSVEVQNWNAQASEVIEEPYIQEGALQIGVPQLGVSQPPVQQGVQQPSMTQPFSDFHNELQRAIARAQSGPSQKRFARIHPGIYRTFPAGRDVHAMVTSVSDIELDCTGVELRCVCAAQALLLFGCRRVTLRGLMIDYETLPFTQARILAVAEDLSWLEVQIIQGYPAANLAPQTHIEVFDAATRQLRVSYTDVSVSLADGDTTRLRLDKAFGGGVERIGDVVILRAHTTQPAVNNTYRAHAMGLENCQDCCLEDVVVYSSYCCAFAEQSCERTAFTRCRVDRRVPLTHRTPHEEFIPRSFPRLRSVNGDAFYSVGALAGPRLTDCVAYYMGGRGIAVHGDYHLVLSKQDQTLRVLSKGHDRLDIVVGEPVELFSQNGVVSSAIVSWVKPLNEIVPNREKVFISGLPIAPQVQQLLASSPLFEVGLKTKIPDGAVFGMLVSSRKVGNGVLVDNCHIGFNGSHAVNLKSSNCVVRGCTFQNCGGSGILLGPEYASLEAGNCRNAQLIGNQIIRCGSLQLCSPIVVASVSGGHSLSPAGAHHDIEIKHNQMMGCPIPGIVLTSVDGGTAEENIIAESEGMASNTLAGLGVAQSSDRVITIACANLTLEGTSSNGHSRDEDEVPHSEAMKDSGCDFALEDSPF